MIKFKRKLRPEDFFARLDSVESFADDKGIHPILEDGTIDFLDTVRYNEINRKEFEKLMSEQDLVKWQKLRKVFGVL